MYHPPSILRLCGYLPHFTFDSPIPCIPRTSFFHNNLLLFRFVVRFDWPCADPSLLFSILTLGGFDLLIGYDVISVVVAEISCFGVLLWFWMDERGRSMVERDEVMCVVVMIECG
jgi:hypothetical protein